MPGGNLKKGNLIKYCNQWWPAYKLESGEKWPPSGILNYNTLLQLMLLLRREEEWDQVMYANMFFTLRNKPEWQKECGINLATQGPLVLALERDNWQKIKRCCSACSIGQRCLKLAEKHEGDSVIDVQDLQLSYPGPAVHSPPAALPPQLSPSGNEDEMDDPGEGTSSGTPVTARTRSKTKKALPLVAPLRQVVGPTAEDVRVKVPFSTRDLNSWREEVWNYREDPSKVAKRFELIVRNQDPDWADTDFMLTELTETQKEFVIKTARAHVQGQIASGTLQGTVDQLFPIANPWWDPSDAGNYAILTRYRELLKFGLEMPFQKQ